MLAVFGCQKSNEYQPNTSCACTGAVSATDKYIYPILPGTPAWNQAGLAGGIDSIYAICQVPDNTLKNMSTLGLIQSLADNPCLFNMFLRINNIQGRNEVLPRLNVNTELLKRPDAGIILINYYNQKQPCCAEELVTDLLRGKYANDWHLFDMVCTQEGLLNKLPTEQKIEFARIVLNKFYIQLNYPSTFGSTKATSALILSQLMILANYSPYQQALKNNADLLLFSQTGLLTTKISYDDILNYGKQFAK
jgi:hypothetical protein